MRRETERYGLLEGKYKDVLVKYNVLAKENAKNAEMLFSMNTGGQIKNYDNYLDRSGQEQDQHQRSSSKGFGKGRASGDTDFAKNFEDVF